MLNPTNEGERIDSIGFGNLRLIQKPGDFCYGIDAVLLASYAAENVKQNASIIDLGTGTGIIPLILSHKTNSKDILGVELQMNSYEIGLRNIKMNNLQDRVRLVNEDVKVLIKKDSSLYNRFDAVLSNPPYVKSNGGLKNQLDSKTIARHETSATLSDFIEAASGLLKDRGQFYMINRPDRLVDICVFCRNNKLEPKKIRFISPNKKSKPNIMLIHCVKNGRPELKFIDPLYVYDEEGKYTDEIMRIYER